MAKIPNPKFKEGDIVIGPTLPQQGATIKSMKWSGFTWMYAFEGLEVRMGEFHLSPITKH